MEADLQQFAQQHPEANLRLLLAGGEVATPAERDAVAVGGVLHFAD
jgi:hypothetical protein